MEPTRQQIKEAFKETIERWEKIVEDVEYLYSSSCALCGVREGVGCKEKGCPIFFYIGFPSCNDTPYIKFEHNKTSANALAELNFLRKAYIWWMEKEANKILDKVAMYGKEEKKEWSAWHNITEGLIGKPYASGDGYSMGIYYNGLKIAFADDDGFFIDALQMDSYKIEKKDSNFLFLKKT